MCHSLHTGPAQELTIENYGFDSSDLTRKFFIRNTAFDLGGTTPIALADIIANLKSVYCQKVGYEYMHVDDVLSREWLRSRIEAPIEATTSERKTTILSDLIAAEGFEEVL